MAAGSQSWNPERYAAFADERARPFHELVARIDADRPRHVVDLGCGPGTLTALLARRWPGASVTGIDSSSDMIAAAGSVPGPRFVLGEMRAWTADVEVDVLVSNAALQWVPGHLDLLPRLVDQVAPGGWFGMQVPANQDEPSHTIRRELAAEAPFAEHTRTVAAPRGFDAQTYLEALTDLGCTVDAWETTYLHVLQGTDPVFTWVSGTGARPTLQALPEDLRLRFETEFRRRLGRAYPRQSYGVLLPFRRVFVVARVPL